MTEQLGEKIALEVHEWHCPDEACVDEVYWTGLCMADYLECADQILVLIKQALPELAKEAGYVKLADVISYFENEIKLNEERRLPKDAGIGYTFSVIEGMTLKTILYAFRRIL